MVRRQTLVSLSTVGPALLVSSVAAAAAPATSAPAASPGAASDTAELDEEPARYAPPSTEPSRFQLGVGTGHMPSSERPSRSSPAGYYDYDVDAWIGGGVVVNVLP